MKLLRLFLYSVIGVILLSFANVYADQKMMKSEAPHGGMLQTTENYILELVIRDQYMDLYISDTTGKARKAEKFQVQATVSKPDGSDTVMFNPSSGNQLVAHGRFMSDDVFVVVLELNAPNNKQDTLIFTKKATAAGATSDRWPGYDDWIVYGWED